jgi:hypothetical protein
MIMADKSTLQEIGATGLENFAGSIRSDFLKEMRGKEGFKHYNEMRLNSPIISGLLLAIEQPLRQLGWNFASDTDGDPRVGFLEEARAGMSLSWNDHITEALTMLPFGYSVFEILYKLNQRGQYVWRKFAPRGQDTVNRWIMDEAGGLTGFEQVCAPTYKPTFIPVEKLVLYRTRVERGNPEGRSILRSAWIPYYYAKHVMQIEAIGTERDLAGLPVLTLPPGASTTDDDTSDFGKARIIVRNIRNDEQAGIVLPGPEWKLELLSTGGARAFDTDKTVRRYESRMLMAALAQFLMLGQDGVGSLALSSSQTDFFTMSINSIADIISETFTKYAIPRLLALNGFDPEGVRLEHTPPGDTDLVGVADFLQKTGSYLNWSAEDETWLRQVGGLPERAAEDIQADMDTKAAAREAAIAAFREKANKPANEDGVDDTEKMGALRTNFATNPPDERKRRKAELAWQRQLDSFFGKQKKRILKAAKEMKLE